MRVMVIGTRAARERPVARIRWTTRRIRMDLFSCYIQSLVSLLFLLESGSWVNRNIPYHPAVHVLCHPQHLAEPPFCFQPRTSASKARTASNVVLLGPSQMGGASNTHYWPSRRFLARVLPVVLSIGLRNSGLSGAGRSRSSYVIAAIDLDTSAAEVG